MDEAYRELVAMPTSFESFSEETRELSLLLDQARPQRPTRWSQAVALAIGLAGGLAVIAALL